MPAMIRAIAIDDEPLWLHILTSFCARVPQLVKLEQTFTKPAEALAYFKEQDIDLLITDINMPSVSGIELYKTLPGSPMVIFTTAHSQYAVEGFNLNAVDYLLKPYTFERFEHAIQKVNDFHKYSQEKGASQGGFIYVKADYTLIKIELKDILYIEALDDYLKIHLEKGRPILTRMTMKHLAEKLPEDQFMRVHRSFIVPVRKVASVRNKTIYIGEHEIPVGSSYEAAFSTRFHT
jgi:DNA-binding LytR/AlgR family response regulator